MTRRVTLRVPEYIRDAIQRLADMGIIASKSGFLRDMVALYAIRNGLISIDRTRQRQVYIPISLTNEVYDAIFSLIHSDERQTKRGMLSNAVRQIFDVIADGYERVNYSDSSSDNSSQLGSSAGSNGLESMLSNVRFARGTTKHVIEMIRKDPLSIILATDIPRTLGVSRSQGFYIALRLGFIQIGRYKVSPVALEVLKQIVYNALRSYGCRYVTNRFSVSNIDIVREICGSRDAPIWLYVVISWILSDYANDEIKRSKHSPVYIMTRNWPCPHKFEIPVKVRRRLCKA